MSWRWNGILNPFKRVQTESQRTSNDSVSPWQEYSWTCIEQFRRIRKKNCNFVFKTLLFIKWDSTIASGGGIQLLHHLLFFSGNKKNIPKLVLTCLIWFRAHRSGHKSKVTCYVYCCSIGLLFFPLLGSYQVIEGLVSKEPALLCR